MSERHDETGEVAPGAPAPAAGREATWGPKLFYAALVASLVFFWWLLIYDHGVGPGHG